MTERLKGLLAIRFRLSAQLYAGIGGAVVMTIAASLVGWFSFDRVGDLQSRVNEGSVPDMTAAFAVAQTSGTLAAAAPRLTTAASRSVFTQVVADIDEARANLQEQLATLEQRAIGTELFEGIRSNADTLISNIDAIQTSMLTRFELNARTDGVQIEINDLTTRLDAVLVPAIDDQIYYAIKGYRVLGEPPAPREEHLSEDEFDLYQRLAQLQADASLAIQVLASAFSLSEAAEVEPLRERFEAAQGRMEGNLTALRDFALYTDLEELLARLFHLGSGEGRTFDLLTEELKLAQRQSDLLDVNRGITVQLLDDVNTLVSDAQMTVQQAAGDSTQAISTGRILLLAIGAVSVGGAVLIAWLFIGRVLLRRLELLSTWMRRMAGGDLEARADVGGHDEVADMAAALEVFRRHALEVQRLNLVEQLAGELQSKNSELEVALGDLEKAQDQIVMQEKLAALGELTAGVAHEIKNPLNFVKNFSEVSVELVTELRDILKEENAELSEDDRSLVIEISEDLDSNLDRIRTHSNRANQIVQDMLRMGGGSTIRQPTNLNVLLDEYARLAYHSARATDSEFQLDLKFDLDEELGEVEVVSQDMGRVFLNMVGNACYATNEKRRNALDAGASDADYMPTLWLATRLEDDQVVIRIRDNGVGIPPEVAEKIFNPFFTTKPTDKGTGLGLAISSDIIRTHGGLIHVDSEPGEYTEMTITLPLVAPAHEAVAQDAADDDE